MCACCYVVLHPAQFLRCKRFCFPELVKLPCLLTQSGRLSKAKVLAYLYQHGETQVMDIVRASATANDRKPIANVHDAIFFKRRLGAELKAEIEWQMRSQTGSPYWHLTAKELKRYESRHFDVIAEEFAHKRRIAAEQAKAVNYTPVGIAEFEVSVALCDYFERSTSDQMQLDPLAKGLRVLA